MIGSMALQPQLATYDVEAQMRAMQEYRALLSAAAAAGKGYDCAAVVSGAQIDVIGAQIELTYNNGGGGGGALASRKRGREVEQFVSSSWALLPIPGMTKALPSPAVGSFAEASRMVESAMTSTSGRPAAAAASFSGALTSELCQQSAEIDALVRAECERMLAGMEQAWKRQRQAVVRAASAAVARRLAEKEAELDAACRRAADLEERLRQAAGEAQAWCGLARSNEAVAAGLRATLDQLLRFGESGPAAVDGADDAQSCCFVAKETSKEDAGSSPVGKWSCKSCGERESSVLVLPCRHLCLCQACEPTLDSCPVCFAVKSACVVARSPIKFC